MLLMPPPPHTHTIVNGNVESVKENCSIADLNLCAFVTGNQAGSPMPPRPPSQHESNPSSRMTQSPMATSKDTLFTVHKCLQPVLESSTVK